MRPARWQQIEGIFHKALARPLPERSTFLENACGGDKAIRREVERLLASDAAAENSFETVAARLAAGWVAEQEKSSLIGERIGRYEVVAALGAGGMGEVYLAQDNSLGRKVALKLLPRQFTREPDRLRRFEQEARAASALNHPNIITIHEIGNWEETQFIATEFIDGETLRDLLAKRRLGLPEILEIGVQAADALGAAHKAGIVHRDIKPANMMVRTDGYVKVLDFGLAKLLAAPASLDVTDPGRVMGTVSYMSPEQARGERLDHRTDIFSLGAVLYEMATGARAFDGQSDAAVYDAILNKAPAQMRRSDLILPAELDRIVRRALEKDRELRYQTASDLRAELKRLERDTGSRPALTLSRQSQPVERGRRTGWKTLVAAGGTAIVATLGYLLWIHNAPKAKARPLTPSTFTRLTDGRGPEQFPSLAPDGKTFVYASAAAGNWDIYLQRVGGKNTSNLTKDCPADDTQPAFSPDGEYVAFRSERDGGGIFVAGSTGENVRRLTDFGFNPAWSPDGKEIVCATEGVASPRVRFTVVSQLWAVKIGSGEKRLLTEEDAVQPNWSPHGQRIAYWGTPKGKRDIWTIPATGGKPVQVTDDAAVDWNPVWSPDGRYLYFASDRTGSMNLWRVEIEEATGKVLSPAESVTIPAASVGHLSFSRDARRMLFVQSDSKNNLQQIGFDPLTGTVIGQPGRVTQGSLQTTDPGLSPDGAWLAFSTSGETQEDIYVSRRDGAALRQLTNDPAKDRLPRWSPDGARIAFQSNRSGTWGIWTIKPDGSGLEQLTFTSETAVYPTWAPDGARLAYSGLSGNPHIMQLDKTSAPPTQLDRLPLDDQEGWFEAWSWSPDNQTLAGWQQSVRHSGGILLCSLHSQKIEKLSESGFFPVWLSDNSRLLFYDFGRLYLVERPSKKVQEVLSVAPYEIDRFDLSRDNRVISYSLTTTEADIWLMSLE